MIDAIEGIGQARPLHHSPAVSEQPTRRKHQSADTDVVEISAAAKATMLKKQGDHPETLIKANLGDPRARHLIEEAAAKRKLLGLDPP